VINVKRSGALGDVVLTTPIIRRLRRENPDAVINMYTAYPDVFAGNLHLVTPDDPFPQPSRLIDLDLAYERLPEAHIVQAYMLEAFGDVGQPADLTQELFFPDRTFFSRDRKYVAVNPTIAGWANRTLPRSTWVSVVNGLRKAGLWPILVGTPHETRLDCDVSQFTSMDIQTIARFIHACAAFVCSDSGLLHVAGATKVPIVSVFTCAKPQTRLPWRNGILGYQCTAIVPDLDCVGCLLRRPPPVTTEHCERGDVACVAAVHADEIVEAVVAAVDSGR